jgi:hypothetical protein
MSADVEALVLVSKPLSHILTFWRPGSHEWTWAEEYADLIDDEITARIDQRVRSEGIHFADGFAPILLGSDGRVWDGHHRIVLAIRYQIPSLMCEIAAPAPLGDSQQPKDSKQ